MSIVNEKNKVISRATRKEVYAKGLLHRAVNVVLKNSHGQIYLQQRSKDKQAFPLYWDISCSEHLKPGETYTEAAKRGLKEELGIEAKVKRIKPQHRQRSEYKQGQETIIENELVETYEAIYNGKLSFDPREVAAGNFFSKQDILKMLSKNQFTPWFIEEWEDMVKTV
ncbi:hypothetical protein A2631_01515 [Candidatus Daviesbacteria bacterium RIFCSPHIGHO2_01_FULL_44_29]|uniref:Nudix hydrolase domain-containing protein n=1 Tax=Candidatus Daviesbacteria bacterium RIFCSPHIGHO2_02_FULL_43_12 TaxID=1797776 RepID=A0A1F5KKS5_9BACT|nr:MAG: hypothetical protein A2631_01515 [Candidatus Daviesbacteria bacterium RIFCSPHIGHO2_01_FULL_44_29]OGE39075.1 MAG: hypothetical protein A3E86_00565 [Candidatus Daviesbacteria bacterium RIFCSPHIGHO2_12_FULL_47_45]OGE41420.1 MAG: hypothetical protein A3D25_00910 [Candidatus Daviesbacteria bacterium RIFCSPHIGHO2_02_FULL_43_12]OGE69620.1 MAG: hypothetical protein A3B55_02650 [Candidatus Daviesbacteria bacterium RIFCSPLOWO2_01_FULL_43_15]